MLAAAGWVWAAAAVAAWLAMRRRATRVRELVARACHEVRGPLTAATLALELMERRAEAPPERVRALRDQMRRAALALEDLDAAPRRDASGERPEELGAAALLTGLHVAWGPVCAARGRELRAGPAPAGALLLADRTRVEQAVGNLIANAMEHGEGTIELRSRLSAGRLRVEVRDEGNGLTRPLQEILDAPRAGRGRRGRGLAIAAGIAQRHGGRLTTAPGGAVLVLELPLLAMEPAAAAWSSR